MKWVELVVAKKTLLMLALVGVTACASARYKSYGIDLEKQMFLAAEPRDDKPFTHCAPRGGVNYPCRMIELEEFRRLLTDLVSTEQKLKACERRERD